MPNHPLSNENGPLWLVAQRVTRNGESASGLRSVEIAATKRAYTIAEVSLVTGFGRSTIYKALTSGALKAVKQGRRTAIPAAEVDAWLASLPLYPIKGHKS